MAEYYSHNLKILIVDQKNNVVKNDELLNKIKAKFEEKNVHQQTYNFFYEMECCIIWRRKKLNKLCKHFLGDLFCNTIYEADSIIYRHTEQTIEKIEKEIELQPGQKIVFYISKMVNNVDHVFHSADPIF
jgi:hypothetical protein